MCWCWCFVSLRFCGICGFVWALSLINSPRSSVSRDSLFQGYLISCFIIILHHLYFPFSFTRMSSSSHVLLYTHLTCTPSFKKDTVLYAFFEEGCRGDLVGTVICNVCGAASRRPSRIAFDLVSSVVDRNQCFIAPVVPRARATARA